MADVVDVDAEKKSSTAAEESMEEGEPEESPVEEVRMTVATTDDPSMPVWTFRIWTLGLASVCLLSFFNQFFSYRMELLMITQITVQVAALPLGHFLARMLPTRRFRVPLLGECSLNPGPFNMKEHVLISIFANAVSSFCGGSAFGGNSAYAVGIVNIIKAFYKRRISFHVAWLLIITTQVLSYSWACGMRQFVVELAHMWWPSTLVQVSLFWALHEKNAKGSRCISRAKFFVIALICSSSWNVIHGPSYMKIPPKSIFLVQLIGTVIAATIDLAVAFLMLNSVENICDSNPMPANSPRKCPAYEIFYDASVIWGLVGPRSIFGQQGHYNSLNWFFLLCPVIVWGFHKMFPENTWVPLINLPVILGAGSMMPASIINYTSWVAVGTLFNFFVYRYRKRWWERYNYVLSAALDGGVAYMAVLLYFSLNMENRSINWPWGSRDDIVYCPPATCPTAKRGLVKRYPLMTRSFSSIRCAKELESSI